MKGLCKIGKNVTLGHLSMVHGPGTIGDYTLIGISASVLQNSKIGSFVVLAGGSVIRGEAEDNCLYAGVPATKKKTYPTRRMEVRWPNHYVVNGQKFKESGLGQEIPKEYLMKDE